MLSTTALSLAPALYPFLPLPTLSLSLSFSLAALGAEHSSPFVFAAHVWTEITGQALQCAGTVTPAGNSPWQWH